MKSEHFRSMTRAVVGILFLASLSGFKGCDYLPVGAVSIAELLSNPTKYDGKEVKVKGVVSDVTRIPLVGIKFYILSDEGRQILVVPKDSIPESRSRVTVIGIFRNIAIVGGESVGPHLEEVKRLDYSL